MRQTRTRILSLLLALVMCLGLLPVTALAAGEVKSNTGYIIVDNPESVDQSPTVYEGVTDVGIEITSGETYNVIFDANGGQFPDGSTTMTVQTKWLGAGNNITTTPQDPTREGYTFDGWDIDFVWNHDFTADTTVKAKWEKKSEMLITLDPNGGRFEDGSTAVKNVPLDSITLGGPIPTVSRFGFTFDGWYMNYESPSNLGVKMENWSFTGSNRLTAVWIPEGAERQEPIRIDFIPNGGTITSIRGIPAKDITPGYPLAVKHDIFVDTNSGIGMMMTDEFGNLDSFPVIERNGYTLDGWYIVDGNIVNDAYAGKEIDIPASAKKVSLSTVFKNGGYLAAKWVKAAETFTVTFDLNGATGTAPAPQKVEKGKTVELPVLRASNAEFLGWGYSTDGKTLVEWKAEYPVTSNLTLYAMWEVSGEDTYDFSNSDSAFADYRITGAYFDFLTEDVGSTWKGYMVEDFIESQGKPVEWGGSCFGMSAVYCMARGGTIDLGVFQRGTTTLRGLKTPRQSQNIQDLINFYMMAQSTIAGSRAKSTYLNLEQTARYKKIVSDLMAEKGFSVLGFNYVRGGHAIVARGVKRSNDGYHIEIWDPNNPEGFGKLVISLDYSNARFTDETYGATGSRGYNVNTVIKYIMPLSTRSQTYDAKNLQSVFGKSRNMSTHSSNSNLYQFSSSTGDFTLTAPDGRSAVVKNGTQVSGDLKLLDNTIDGGPSSDYRFSVEASDLNQVTITLDGKKSEFTFVSDTIMAKAAADSLSSVVIDGDTVATTCATSAEQKITVVSDKLGNTWNKVTVSGKDTGFTLTAGSGQLNVSSKNNASVTIQGENVDTRKTSDKQTVAASSSGTAVAMNSLGTGTQQPAGTNPFSDVQAGAYYYDAVLWAVDKKITSGTSATTFSPGNPCTRGQIVTFLWRAAGSPKPTSSNNPFIDVKAGAYYYDAVLWAVEKGITSGTSATTFSPDTACTRGQTVTFLWRAAGSPKAASSTNPFSDVKSGAYYYDAVLWAVEQKVTSGTSATTFAPGSTVTRGQTVTFLYRSQGN